MGCATEGHRHDPMFCHRSATPAGVTGNGEVRRPSDTCGRVPQRGVSEFLSWITHDGQKYCDKQHYAALPQVLVKNIEDKLKKIEAEQ